MRKRIEFSDKTKTAAYERSGGRCEECGRPFRHSGDINYDHRDPSYFSENADLDNCSVLCRSCHGNKTRERDIPTIAKSRRISKRRSGIKRRPGFAGWRRFDGTLIWARDKLK